MAWRIQQAVIRGEIDNTVEGTTQGRVWLAGRDEPLVLDLNGDCWRDLAGTRLKFSNPVPKEMEDIGTLVPGQKGIIGDMTASRKNRLPVVDEREFQKLFRQRREIPCEWRNTLYLEWFSDVNGRVVIESSDYELEISEYVWSMDVDAEEAQKLANLNAMRDFMAQVIRRRENDDSDEDPADLDEFAWEERLKESDRLTDAYQEVLEKYMDDEDSERKEAFVMGWDGLLDAMAERDESETGRCSGEDDDDDEAYDRADEFDLGDQQRHPLQIKAQELAMLAMDLVEGDGVRGTPSYQLVTSLLQVSGKLAGALNWFEDDHEPETGYVLAVLKRCLNWLNEAVGACQELMAVEEDADQLAALAHIRSSAFEIRDGITELRREMK